MRQPQLIIVAGPNGVGKSTYTQGAFGTGFLLLDPDRLAARHAQTNPIGAGRVAIEQAYRALYDRSDLIVETTLSGQYPLRILTRAGERGYSRALIYIGIDDSAECLRRVRRRVAEGGHDVPRIDVLRRYGRSLTTLPLAIGLAERVTLIDNPVHGSYGIIAQSDPDGLFIHRSIPCWATTAVDKLAHH